MEWMGGTQATTSVGQDHGSEEALTCEVVDRANITCRDAVATNCETARFLVEVVGRAIVPVLSL